MRVYVRVDPKVGKSTDTYSCSYLLHIFARQFIVYTEEQNPVLSTILAQYWALSEAGALLCLNTIVRIVHKFGVIRYQIVNDTCSMLNW